MLNLISNSLKFVEENSIIKITTCLQTVNFRNKTLSFSIYLEDTGAGMTKEGTKELFKDFSVLREGAA